jgi:two-component system chemotaxis response regulator CheY
MASMTGGQLLQSVRANERIAGTPFIMVANDNGEDMDARAGASNTILRPFTAQSLKSKLVPVIGAF